MIGAAGDAVAVLHAGKACSERKHGVSSVRGCRKILILIVNFR